MDNVRAVLNSLSTPQGRHIRWGPRAGLRDALLRGEHTLNLSKDSHNPEEGECVRQDRVKLHDTSEYEGYSDDKRRDEWDSEQAHELRHRRALPRDRGTNSHEEDKRQEERNVHGVKEWDAHRLLDARHSL